MNKGISNISGEIHYRYSSLKSLKELKNVVTTFYNADEVKVVIGGNEVKFDQPPIIENGRTLVPLRAIFEELGANVTYNDSNKTIIATKDDNEITLAIGSNVMSRGTKRTKLDVVAKVVNGRTLVPLRAVSEAFDKDVSWESKTKTVVIR